MGWELLFVCFVPVCIVVGLVVFVIIPECWQDLRAMFPFLPERCPIIR